MRPARRRPSLPRRPHPPGVTFLELLAVVLILGILATIVTNVYVGQISRARVAATLDIIRELEVAIGRYETDTGQLPPSGSATVSVTTTGPVISNRERQGNGLLYLALVHSLNGNVHAPLSPLWKGPYLEFNAEALEHSETLGQTQILDAFGRPLQYVNSLEYAVSPFAGAQLFSGAKPAGASPSLPANNAFAATETFYNPSTFQLYSFGPDGITFGPPFPGAQFDDINNYGY